MSPRANPPAISVAIVAWNSARWLPSCLDSVAAQSLPPLDVVVLDNASADDGARIAGAHPVVTRVERSASNAGFAGGQNRAIRATRGDWVLTLNPDVVLEPDFLERLGARAASLEAAVPEGARASAGGGPPEGAPAEAPGTPARGAASTYGAEAPARVGTLCGKLRRLLPDLSRADPPTLDSTGIVFRRDFRHLDRGSGEVDRGQWDREEEVFGATAAAALYRRAMIEDVSVDGEFFDEAFFAYREDADVAWRAQLLGWGCLYVPGAVGYHVRSVLPERRREVPAVLNRHSVKNRFLMRIKNADAAVWRRCGLRGLLRDAAVVGGCLAGEWSSLPAFADVARLWPRARRQRAWIQARRRRGGAEIARWFA